MKIQHLLESSIAKCQEGKSGWTRVGVACHVLALFWGHPLSDPPEDPWVMGISPPGILNEDSEAQEVK